MNIILLRGLMREARHWGQFTKDLQECKNVDKVLCLDFPGIGTEEKRIFYPSLSQVVRDLRSRFVQHENNKQDWAILGFSLGGMVALEWIQMYPNDFRKVILLNTSASNVGKLWERVKPQSMVQLLKIFFEQDPIERERKVIQMVSNLRNKDPKLVQEWGEIAKTSEFSRFTALNQLAAAAQFKLPERISVPALVLTSRADRMVDYQNSVRIAHKYQAELHIHPTAGHDLTVDDSQWCVEKICSWL
jgi:pimeloyl-ACP methyl ester carboxylesterase